MKVATIGIRVSEADKKKLEALAADRDIPVSQLVREAIKEYLTKEKLK